MKRKILAVALCILCSAVNAFGADGDLIVNGKVGVGTPSPQNPLHIIEPGNQGIIVEDTANANANGQLIFRKSRNGSIIASGDYIGSVRAEADDGSGFPDGAVMNFISEGTIATGKVPMSIQFMTMNNAGAWGERARITADGNVGIGTTTPQYTLDVAGTIRANNVSPSDIRFKRNITPLEGSLEKVEKLQGVSYDWRTEEFKEKHFEEGRQIGLIAQEVETVLPELVKTDPQGYKAVSYEKLTAVLIEAMKEQQKEIEQYKSKQVELEERIKRLEGAGR